MDTAGLESAIISRGRQLNNAIASEVPSVFNKDRWVGKVMDWCMRHEDFKINFCCDR